MYSQAQVSVGPKLGLNFSKFHGNKEADISDNTMMKVGYQIGGVLNAQINDYFSIRPELFFNNVGSKFSSGGARSTFNLNYISLPVNFVGQYPINDNVKLQGFVGPYIAYGLGGKVKVEYMSDKEEYSIKMKKMPENLTTDAIYLNSLDLGLNFGLGLQAKSFVFSASYAMGFTNIEPHYTDSQSEDKRGEDGKIYNRNISFGVAYLFGGK